MERRYYYEKSSVLKNINKFVNSREAAVSFSTVNDNGSPNVSVMIPSMTEDDKYLIVGMGDSNTKRNLQKRKQAMVLFYKYDKSENDKFSRNIGVRLLVELEESNDVHKKYEVSVKAMMLRVIEVIPLG